MPELDSADTVHDGQTNGPGALLFISSVRPRRSAKGGSGAHHQQRKFLSDEVSSDLRASNGGSL